MGASEQYLVLELIWSKSGVSWDGNVWDSHNSFIAPHPWPDNSENCDNVSSQTDDVMPHSQRGSLCTGIEVSNFESGESEGQWSLSTGASEDSYEHENRHLPEPFDGQRSCHLARFHESEFRGYLIQIGPPTITTEFSPETRVIRWF